VSPDNWDTEINPYDLYWVSPENIFKSEVKSFDFLSDTGKIINGTWDTKRSLTTNSVDYQRFKEHFHSGVPWEQTVLYQSHIKKMHNNEAKRYLTIEEFEDKLEKYDQMYESFNNNEYLLQSELVNNKPVTAVGEGGRALLPRFTNHTLIRHEVAVNIARDGILLLNEGRHRVALAQLSELNEIPVRIVVRHTEWQQLRDNVAQTIDEALRVGIPEKDIKQYVASELKNEIENVHRGLEHPDINVVFEQMLSRNKL